MFTTNTNNSEKSKENKTKPKKQNKETKTEEKKNNSYKLNQKHATCFNVEKIHCRKTHCSVGLGTEKWKK